MSRTRQSQEFARAFGDALKRFLNEKNIAESEAARRMGWGEAGRARVNTYCHDSPKGIRRTPEADVLYLACVSLPGFEFEYKGFKIGAAAFNGGGAKPTATQPIQLQFEYDCHSDLTDQREGVSFRFKRPPSRVEVSVSVRAVS